jgi:hypothetical protein
MVIGLLSKKRIIIKTKQRDRWSIDGANITVLNVLVYNFSRIRRGGRIGARKILNGAKCNSIEGGDWQMVFVKIFFPEIPGDGRGAPMGCCLPRSIKICMHSACLFVQ